MGSISLPVNEQRPPNGCFTYCLQSRQKCLAAVWSSSKKEASALPMDGFEEPRRLSKAESDGLDGAFSGLSDGLSDSDEIRA